MIRQIVTRYLHKDPILHLEHTFKISRDIAKATGKLLGCYLALRWPFMTQGITLMGFSLGTQVIKYTLRTLHELKVDDVIENVICLGGAATQCDDDYEAFQEVINGKLINCYSEKDLVLQTLAYKEEYNKVNEYNPDPNFRRLIGIN